MTELDKVKADVMEREIRIKERELELRVSESKKTAWKSPIVLAVFAAALGAFGNAAIAFYNANLAREAAEADFKRTNQLEVTAAENVRILQMIKTGDQSEVQKNLEFLIGAGLIKNPGLTSGIKQYYLDSDPNARPGVSLSNYLDDLTAQDALLRGAIDQDIVSLFSTDRFLTIRIAEDKVFAFGSDTILTSFESTLSEIAASLRQFTHSRISVVVHTDNNGDTSAKADNALVRANRVVQELVNLGVESKRIAGVSIGDVEPIADNGTVEGRRLNRRIEITLFAY